MNTSSSPRKIEFQSALDESPQSDILELRPESSFQLPLKSCFFTQIQCKPKGQREPLSARGSMLDENAMFGNEESFEWTDLANVCLMNDERSIFETPPVVMSSKCTRDKNLDRKNNKIFFVVVPSVYSIRSFLDFNTQQTEFISLRYLTIAPPFQF